MTDIKAMNDISYTYHNFKLIQTYYRIFLCMCVCLCLRVWLYCLCVYMWVAPWWVCVIIFNFRYIWMFYPYYFSFFLYWLINPELPCTLNNKQANYLSKSWLIQYKLFTIYINWKLCSDQVCLSFVGRKLFVTFKIEVLINSFT